MPQHFSSLKRLSFIGLTESLWNVRCKGLTVVVDWRKGSIQKNASIPRMTRPGSAIIEPFLSTTDKQANRKGGRALFVRCRTRYNQKPSCALTKNKETFILRRPFLLHPNMLRRPLYGFDWQKIGKKCVASASLWISLRDELLFIKSLLIAEGNLTSNNLVRRVDKEPVPWQSLENCMIECNHKYARLRYHTQVWLHGLGRPRNPPPWPAHVPPGQAFPPNHQERFSF